MAAVALGARWWPVLGFLALYNVARALTGIWALRTGYDGGMDVGAAIAKSWIPRRDRPDRAGGRVRASGSRCPLVAAWYLRGFGWAGALGALAVAATGVAVTRWFGAALTSVRFALLAMVLLVLFRGMGL